MPAAATRPPGRPTVQLRPVPPLDPPFDDERAPEVWLDRPTDARRDGCLVRSDGCATAHPGDGATAPTGHRTGAPVAATARPDTPSPGAGRPAPSSRPGRPATAATEQAPPAVGLTGASPEARQAARTFVTDCLEIMNGYRPAQHIRARCDPAETGRVVTRLIAASHRIAARGPGRPPRRALLRRLRVCEPRPGIVEAAAAIGVPGRTWAMAFRLERRRGRWVGVSVEVL
jgi:hypothetical protein